jgi:hypothetical protein
MGTDEGRARRVLEPGVLVVLLLPMPAMSCSSPSEDGAANTPGSDASTQVGTGGMGMGRGSAAALASRLGKTNFLIGLGPRESPYPMAGQLDIKYAYLVGARDPANGWPKWNQPDGEYATIVADEAEKLGVIPMFDIYEFAALGDGNFEIVRDAQYMTQFWTDVALLADKLKAFDRPAIVHVEPDFWGYAQQNSPGGDPTAFSAQVKIAPPCSDLPDDLTGLGRCAMRILHGGPKVIVGLHGSQWAAFGSNGQPDGGAVGRFVAKVSGGEADFIATDILDRDAGCFEAKPAEFDCGRGGTTGWYWDESNQASPNFHEYLDWSRTLAEGATLPLMWWQTPLGAPSDMPGGSPGRYRDNRVHYIFSHVREFIDVGGVGVAFGAGAKGQTGITTDDGQFENALKAYNQHPEPLP